jgi:hypothetical protein
LFILLTGPPGAIRGGIWDGIPVCA